MQMTTTNQQLPITVQSRGQLTHLVNIKSKRIWIWYCQMRHINNAKIIRASKFLTGIGNLDTKYDPKNVYSDSKHWESEDDTNTMKEMPELLTAFAFHTTDSTIISNFDSIYYPCISSKQIRVVNHRQLMTKTKQKLKEIYVNL